jgi:UDP-N-acetylmuramate dehydrogenase
MKLLRDFSLKSYNTFGVDVSCQTFAEVGSIEELQALIGQADLLSEGLMILGEGSNILFVGDVLGLVLRINIQGRTVVHETSEEIWLRVGAGESWQELVKHCVDQNWGGIENLAGIPGSVGAAPVQNIGAYGVEISGVLQQVDALEVPSGRMLCFSCAECGCTYRGSVFKREWKDRAAITHVTLRLSKHPRPKRGYAALDEELDRTTSHGHGIRDVYEAVMRIRRDKLPDPAKVGNAGSFFKNPELPIEQVEILKKRFPGLVAYPAYPGRMKVAAAYLIEQTCWKGRRIGRCGVHEHQALVLVNFDGASGPEIFALSEEIRQSVLDMFGLDLEREVVLAGGHGGQKSHNNL